MSTAPTVEGVVQTAMIRSVRQAWLASFRITARDNGKRFSKECPFCIRFLNLSQYNAGFKYRVRSGNGAVTGADDCFHYGECLSFIHRCVGILPFAPSAAGHSP
jgi:hypothetical protein